MAMFANYLRTALRSIRRHRVHTFLNVIGLPIGMACTIVIVGNQIRISNPRYAALRYE
jgi:hypothetical protein